MALGGIFGITGASIGGAAMANRTGGVQEFQFEKCTVLDDGSSRASVFESGQVTPKDDVLHVEVQIPREGRVVGGLLAWEYSTSQRRAMLVGRVSIFFSLFCVGVHCTLYFRVLTTECAVVCGMW